MWRVKSLDAILATAEKKSLHRSLGPVQLTLLGVGAIIGTGIFVLTAAAAQKAGPGMMWSFVIAGAVCAVAALCYSELASMAPVSGSAYTYTYAAMGELLAWMVGWALILEYAVAASAVSVGWSGYVLGLIENAMGFDWPDLLQAGPAWSMNGFIPTPDFSVGIVNIPAIIVALGVTLLLMIGTTESARVNAVLVAIKVAALTAFVVLTLPILDVAHFSPFAPNGVFGPAGTSGMGIVGAAASIFFAYVGFDAVSTAAEETKNPQRNVPIGLIGSLAICTVFYLLVAVGAVGAIGAQPVLGAAGEAVQPGSAVQLITMVDVPDGRRQLVSNMTSFGSQNAYRTGTYSTHGSRYGLRTRVVQRGDRAEVFIRLIEERSPNRTLGSGAAILRSGETEEITLSNGFPVTVSLLIRPETAYERERGARAAAKTRATAAAREARLIRANLQRCRNDASGC